MPRVKRGIQTHKRHASLLELAKGYRTGRNNLYKRASEAVMQAGQFA
jgi:large subunit ribosomal protein L20